jgi:hypothetical protein
MLIRGRHPTRSHPMRRAAFTAQAVEAAVGYFVAGRQDR